jgi:hypothetical protein
MDQRPQGKDKTIKFLEENTGIGLYDCGEGSDFLDMLQKISM